MSEYERLSLHLLWLIAQGQLLSISQNANELMAASVLSHEQALGKVKAKIEAHYSDSALAEIARVRAEAEAAKARCEELVAKYSKAAQPIETQTFTT